MYLYVYELARCARPTQQIACWTNSPSNLVEEIPVPNLECLPYFRRIVDGVSYQLALLTQLEIDLLLVVLAFDMRHVYGDEDVCRLLLEAY